MNTILYWIAGVILAALMGFGGGYLARGDCAKEVRATEATSTAKAETKAATINTKFEVNRARQQGYQQGLKDALDKLPPAEPVPDGCPLIELGDDELRLWNAGNQGGHEAVQQLPKWTERAHPLPPLTKKTPRGALANHLDVTGQYHALSERHASLAECVEENSR
jgi:hypothetical protein